jgi:hypothetical protein
VTLQTLAKDMNATLAATGGKCEGVDKFADFLATQGKEYKHGDVSPCTGHPCERGG